MPNDVLFVTLTVGILRANKYPKLKNNKDNDITITVKAEMLYPHWGFFIAKTKDEKVKVRLTKQTGERIFLLITIYTNMDWINKMTKRNRFN